MSNPFAGEFESIDKASANLSTNKKANRSILYAFATLIILLLGILVPEANVSIFIVIIISTASVYYARSAKKDGILDSKKVKLANIVSKTVSIIVVLAFILNIIGVFLTTK